MTTYILDIKTTEHVALAPGSTLSLTYDTNRCYVHYYFKIDNNGNVDISKSVTREDDRKPIRQEGRGIEQVLKISDNIPIPNYFIDIINLIV